MCMWLAHAKSLPRARAGCFGGRESAVKGPFSTLGASMLGFALYAYPLPSTQMWVVGSVWSDAYPVPVAALARHQGYDGTSSESRECMSDHVSKHPFSHAQLLAYDVSLCWNCLLPAPVALLKIAITSCRSLTSMQNLDVTRVSHGPTAMTFLTFSPDSVHRAPRARWSSPFYP